MHPCRVPIPRAVPRLVSYDVDEQFVSFSRFPWKHENLRSHTSTRLTGNAALRKTAGLDSLVNAALSNIPREGVARRS